MILYRLTHFVTLSLGLKRRGNASPPPHGPLIIPHYLHIALEAGMNTPQWKDSGCSLPPLPLCNLQSLLLSPLDLGSRSWDAPVSSWLTIFCEERGLPPQVPPAFHHQTLEKSHRRMHVVTKMKSLDWLFQRKEWSCLLRENWIRKGEEGNERRKEKLAWFLLQSFCLKVWVLWARRWRGRQGSFYQTPLLSDFQFTKKSTQVECRGEKQSDEQKWLSLLKRHLPSFPLLWRESRCC